MKEIKVLSVFADNKPGKIERLTEILAEQKINILAITITSMGDFGVLKFIVDKPEEGLRHLKEDGFAATINKVFGFEMKDSPGGLHQVTKALRERGVNIDNAYVLVPDSRKKALLVVETKDSAKAKKIRKL